MTRRNIFAYTAPGVNYPEYLSVNLEENGIISVTVRNAGGEIATITLPLDESIRFVGQFETREK